MGSRTCRCWRGWMKSVAPPAEHVSVQTNTATPSSASALPAPKFTTNNKLQALQHTYTIFTWVNHYLDKKIHKLALKFQNANEEGWKVLEVYMLGYGTIFRVCELFANILKDHLSWFLKPLFLTFPLNFLFPSLITLLHYGGRK